ncbi:hypothetical protein [Listeria monocytogenes]|uniref:hypothetical protein n=1 Tax=Listeria monocytogenes TaxID=1639 RepID=UPI00190F32D0|nr:hypothetical protein [Listeria monocytogenes]EHK4067399.1 hypothetical protein [Listeria monocytogenes]EKZ1457538.1 hypothetical protein [Listeria monocytogenes]
MGENTSKSREFGVRLLFLLIIFVPITVLIKFNYNWQIVLIGLAASLSFSFICGINKFQTFKIGKDGVEVKKAVEEAKDVLEEINSVVKDYVLLNLLNANKIGINPDEIIESVDEVDRYSVIIQERNINDAEISKQLKKFKLNILLKIIEIIKCSMADIRISATNMNQGIDVINYLEKIVRTKNVISVKKLTELTRTFNTNFEDDFNASLHCEQLRYVIESSLSYYEKFFDYLI